MLFTTRGTDSLPPLSSGQLGAEPCDISFTGESDTQIATNILSVPMSLPSLKWIVFRGYGGASDLLSNGARDSQDNGPVPVGILAEGPRIGHPRQQGKLVSKPLVPVIKSLLL